MFFERDSLSRFVCNIRTPNLAGDGEKVGTAVLVGRSEQELFLLTATHVIAEATPRSYIVLAADNGIPRRLPLRVFLGGSGFQHHPIADLSAAQFTRTAINAPLLVNRFFPFDHINTQETLVSKDAELTTIGFPNGLGAMGARFSPLTYRTFAASPALTLARFDTHSPCDFIILESPAMGGYSGGPVFDLGYVVSGSMRSNKSKTILHGIVHGTISDKTGGKLAAVTPGKYLNGWL